MRICKELNISQIVTANGAFPGIVSTVIEFKERTGIVIGGGSTVEAVRGIRSKCYELGQVGTFVKASKRMKRELSLVGVGKYLKNEMK